MIGERCYVCNSEQFDTVALFKNPPRNENTFGIRENYLRELRRCHNCNSFFNHHRFNLDEIYSGQYREHSYLESDAAQSRFHKIISLPESHSDNKQRCTYIIEKALISMDPRGLLLLDVGSGMGVFPYEMSSRGYTIDAIDPDPKNCEFISSIPISGDVYTGKFQELVNSFAKRYDFISFNKVLEHIPDFKKVIETAKHLLKPSGIIYIELPDADGAANDSYTRQEFFLEHYFAPSRKGITYLASELALEIIGMSSVVEPSGKYTSRLFCRSEKDYAKNM